MITGCAGSPYKMYTDNNIYKVWPVSLESRLLIMFQACAAFY